jgi:hypothetical protein
MAQFELQQFSGEFAGSSKAPSNFTSVRPSVRIYRLCSHLTDFLEIWYWWFSLKPVQKNQIWLELPKNIVNFIWSPKYGVFFCQRHKIANKSAVFEWNVTSPLRQRRRRNYANAPQWYVTSTLPTLLNKLLTAQNWYAAHNFYLKYF